MSVALGPIVPEPLTAAPDAETVLGDVEIVLAHAETAVIVLVVAATVLADVEIAVASCFRVLNLHAIVRTI